MKSVSVIALLCMVAKGAEVATLQELKEHQATIIAELDHLQQLSEKLENKEPTSE